MPFTSVVIKLLRVQITEMNSHSLGPRNLTASLGHWHKLENEIGVSSSPVRIGLTC